MKKIRGLALLTVSVIAGTAVANPEALWSLFPMRGQITTTGAGLCRLEVPAEVIGRCRADLADVRILGQNGREIPYIVDSPEPTGTYTKVHYGAPPEVITAERSSEALDDRVTAYRERFVLALPALPADVPAWDLVLSISRAEFVSRIDVVAVRPGGELVEIVTGGSIFRLPSAGAEKLRLTIPTRDAVRLDISIESQDQGYLQPRFSVESSRILPLHSASTVELGIAERRPIASSTELVIDRPRGLVPRRLAISTTTGTFHRRITVWDEGPGADAEPLAVSAVLRVAAVAPVEVLEIPLRTPRGDRLRVVIENQDSPPLENIALVALMPRPVLVFSLPQGTPSATLYFGGGRAHRPHYDLAGLDPQRRLPAGGEAAQQALAILDPTRARKASFSQIEPNPDYDPSPALAFAMHPGAPIDARLWSHRRHLEIEPSTEGLSRLLLVPADLATLRQDSADLRIIDGDGRQWAYLRQDRARSAVVDLEITNHRSEDKTSFYTLDLPDGALALERIDFESDAPYFDRDFILRGQLEDGSMLDLARGRLIRQAGDPRPTTISLESKRVVQLGLEIEDGDDAPLAFRRVEARTSVPDIYLAAAAGKYELLLGYPDAEPPVYELERVRSTILAVPAAEAVVGSLDPNPAFSAARRLSGAGATQKLLLWGVLGLAVIVLVVLTLRAARQEGSKEAP